MRLLLPLLAACGLGGCAQLQYAESRKVEEPSLLERLSMELQCPAAAIEAHRKDDELVAEGCDKVAVYDLRGKDWMRRGTVGRIDTGGPIEFNHRMERPKRLSGANPLLKPILDARLRKPVLFRFRCLIREDGSIAHCQTVEGGALADASAREAILGWRFTPPEFRGRPVAVMYEQRIRMNPPTPLAPPMTGRN